MDSQIIYSLFGLIVFIVIAVKIMRSNPSHLVNDKETKRAEILSDYKDELREALEPLRNDRTEMLRVKKIMIKKFSDELSMNIFFDAIEIREIVLDLIEDY